jgi:hypothetical protein
LKPILLEVKPEFNGHPIADPLDAAADPFLTQAVVRFAVLLPKALLNF